MAKGHLIKATSNNKGRRLSSTLSHVGAEGVEPPTLCL